MERPVCIWVTLGAAREVALRSGRTAATTLRVWERSDWLTVAAACWGGTAETAWPPGVVVAGATVAGAAAEEALPEAVDDVVSASLPSCWVACPADPEDSDDDASVAPDAAAGSEVPPEDSAAACAAVVSEAEAPASDPDVGAAAAADDVPPPSAAVVDSVANELPIDTSTAKPGALTVVSPACAADCCAATRTSVDDDVVEAEEGDPAEVEDDAAVVDDAVAVPLVPGTAVLDVAAEVVVSVVDGAVVLLV